MLHLRYPRYAPDCQRYSLCPRETILCIYGLKYHSFLFFLKFLFRFIETVLQFFKLDIYLTKALENTHIWLQVVAKILDLLNFRKESCLKSIKNTIEIRTHTHTHARTHTHTYTHKQFRFFYRLEGTPSTIHV